MSAAAVMEELNKSGTMTILVNPDMPIVSLTGKVSSWPAGPCILTLDPEKNGEKSPNLVGPRQGCKRLVDTQRLPPGLPSPSKGLARRWMPKTTGD